jgi:antitoxin HicB
VVSCPSLPGCYTQGDTIDEALKNIKEAILLCLEDMQAQNQPIPDTSRTLISSVAVAL